MHNEEVTVDENSFQTDNTSESIKDKPSSSYDDVNKSIFTLRKSKLLDILSCTVCSELRRCTVYQCKNGDLICAGCFGDILSESRLQNEIALCPKCQTTISKELCSRNVAAEKTISELPVSCYHCLQLIPPEEYDCHKKWRCEKRPGVCHHVAIGCSWQGNVVEKAEHDALCPQPSLKGEEILECLRIMDEKYADEDQLYQKIFDVLSEEKFAYYDLQFKKAVNPEAGEINAKNVMYFQTSMFSAFDNLWSIRAHYIENQFAYQLVARSKFNISISLHYVIVKGPYSELHIQPTLGFSKFSEKSKESSLNFLTFLCNPDTLRKIFSSERINFRLFLFVNTK